MSDQHPSDSALPLEPDRQYDLPGGPHLGRAAALNVPCSEGPATFLLERPEVSNTGLIEAEPRIEPARLMEAGTEYDRETIERLRPLYTPIDAEYDFD
jgi:hypothetical protein